MQRREFLRSSLLLGATGAVPGVALAASQLSDNAPSSAKQVLLTLNDSEMLDLLKYAIKRDDLEFVKSLVRQGADVNAKRKYGMAPIYEAARCDSVKTLQYLVSKGADVNAKESCGRTPLHISYP